jgi:K+-transporting ATPase ATPase C chain
MKDILTSVLLILVFTVLLGLVYPFAVWGISQIVFPHQANGSLIVKDGKTIGSEIIGQRFDSDKYFHSRLSVNDYDASNSGGSNLAQTNKKLIERINTDANKTEGQIPIDLITTSASGLDPHITPAAAEFQIKRVAQSRGVSEEKVRQIVLQHTEGRLFGIFGEPRVNVLKLNLGLDKLS